MGWGADLGANFLNFWTWAESGLAGYRGGMAEADLQSDISKRQKTINSGRSKAVAATTNIAETGRLTGSTMNCDHPRRA